MEKPLRMKRLRPILIIVLSLVAVQCQEPPARRAVNKKQQFFLNQSAQRNKSRIAVEQKLFEQIRKAEPERNYTNSNKGFWFAILENQNQSSPLPQKGEEVVLSYRIEDLNKNVLYDEKELGEARFLVDQEDFLPALREAAKVLRVGQKAIFLFPSYLCYGYQGNFDKIGSNQPLRFTIKLVSLSKFKT